MRHRWATPQRLVDELAFRFAGGRFHLDAAAERWSAKAPLFYTPKEDAFVQPWGPVRDVIRCARVLRPPERDAWLLREARGARLTSVFLNMPFSQVARWVELAFHWVHDERKVRVAVLVTPPGIGTKWWGLARRQAEIYEPEGRIAYEPPPGIDESTPRGPTCAVVIRRPLSVADLRGP